MKKLILGALIACMAGVCLLAQQQGVDYVTQIRNKPAMDPRQFNFSFVSGQGVSGNLSVPGSNTLTLVTAPLGVNGADTAHSIYISGGTGTAEPVLISGGTCMSLASNCTLIVTTANAHTGLWSVSSATSGAEEAIVYAGNNTNSVVQFPAGVFPIHAPITWQPYQGIRIAGMGTQTTILSVAQDFPLTAAGVFTWYLGSGPPGRTGETVAASGAQDLTIQFIQPDSTNIADYTHWPPAFQANGGSQYYFYNIEIIAAWDGFNLGSISMGGAKIENVSTSAFHQAIIAGTLFDTLFIENFRHAADGLTANQLVVFVATATGATGLYLARVDDLKVDNSIFGAGVCMNLHTNGAGGSTVGAISNIWCDTGSNTISAGQLHISNSHFGSALDHPLLNVTGGVVQVDNSTFVNSLSGLTQPMLRFAPVADAGAFGAATLSVSNSYFNSFSSDITSIYCGDVESSATAISYCNLTGNYFYRSGGLTYGNSTILQQNAAAGSMRMTVTGNTASDAGAGGNGFFVTIGSDDYHTVSANNIGRYQIGYTGNMTKIRISPVLSRTFVNLGAVPPASVQIYCTNCTTAATCAASGTGHMATSNGTAWTCQ